MVSRCSLALETRAQGGNTHAAWDFRDEFSRGCDERAHRAVVNLFAPNGKPRLLLIVDSLGAARIEFLDVDGTITSVLPSK